jgi:hypothetical protein
MDYVIMAVAFGPAALLVGWALWVKLHEPPATSFDDFLEHEDFWGRQ